MNIRLTATLMTVLLAAAASLGQAPLSTAFTYQGRLKDAGSPANGLHDLRFRLYDAVSGGAQVGATVCFDNVSVTDGLFTVPLDFGAQFDGQERFLEIDVRADTGLGCANPAGLVLLTPRQALTAAPNALFALNASGLNLPYSGVANVPSPSAVFKLSNTNGSNGSAVWGETAGTTGVGVLGTATATTGNAYGGQFYSASTTGRGVFGQASAATGLAIGGRFGSLSTGGIGVWSTANATTGNTYGIYGDALSTSGIGVYGLASASTGSSYGGYFQSNSGSGIGVYGVSTTTELYQDTYGVYGRTNNKYGAGVVGWNNSVADSYSLGVSGGTNGSTGVGVQGYANSLSGGTWGVLGYVESNSGRGVYGYANNASGTTFGVYGKTVSPSGWAIWADGRLGASGTKSFRIDHPDDPENQYLLHYSAESPEPLNVYRGTVITDQDGCAWVQLPEYYAEINKDPSYQLTVVDDTAGSGFVQVKVGHKIKGNRFMIMTSAPNIEVCWEVKAVRNDRWVQKYGAPVEVDKEGAEKGKYQHPELYGQPPELGMNYDAKRERPSPAVAPEATPR